MEEKFCYSCRHVGVARQPHRALTYAGYALLIASMVFLVVQRRPRGLASIVAAIGTALVILARSPSSPRCARCGGISLYALDSPEAREARAARRR